MKGLLSPCSTRVLLEHSWLAMKEWGVVTWTAKFPYHLDTTICLSYILSTNQQQPSQLFILHNSFPMGYTTTSPYSTPKTKEKRSIIFISRAPSCPFNNISTMPLRSNPLSTIITLSLPPSRLAIQTRTATHRGRRNPHRRPHWKHPSVRRHGHVPCLQRR